MVTYLQGWNSGSEKGLKPDVGNLFFPPFLSTHSQKLVFHLKELRPFQR